MRTHIVNINRNILYKFYPPAGCCRNITCSSLRGFTVYDIFARGLKFIATIAIVHKLCTNYLVPKRCKTSFEMNLLYLSIHPSLINWVITLTMFLLSAMPLCSLPSNLRPKLSNMAERFPLLTR